MSRIPDPLSDAFEALARAYPQQGAVGAPGGVGNCGAGGAYACGQCYACASRGQGGPSDNHGIVGPVGPVGEIGAAGVCGATGANACGRCSDCAKRGEGGAQNNESLSAASQINQAGGSMFQLLNNDQLTDVQLLCGPDGEIVRAHRVVLAAASPVFLAMFTTAGTSEAEYPHVVRIPDVDAHHMRLFVQMLYRTSVFACTDEYFACIGQLCDIAQKYQSQRAANQIVALAEVYSVHCFENGQVCNLSAALKVIRLYQRIYCLQESLGARANTLDMPQRVSHPLLRFVKDVWQDKVVNGRGFESLYLMQTLLETLEES